ncbi:hypothetical protein CYY_002468 [Polysphondylium violaceum]|uniref:Uncharacterized protein n=1 Tax=Polysphondylium violaceum TaxID=133409 RepID=A0A8J4Q180_9MYCE|nr:hypothetical protein CYY_002468 [Polysphondylium violaceum]
MINNESAPVPVPCNKAGPMRISKPNKKPHTDVSDSPPLANNFVSTPVNDILFMNPANSPSNSKMDKSPKMKSEFPPQPTVSQPHKQSAHNINQPR